MKPIAYLQKPTETLKRLATRYSVIIIYTVSYGIITLPDLSLIPQSLALKSIKNRPQNPRFRYFSLYLATQRAFKISTIFFDSLSYYSQKALCSR